MTDTIDRREALRRSLFAAGIGPLCCMSPEAPAGSFKVEDRRLVLDLEQTPLLGKPGSAVAVVDAGHKVNLIVVQSERGVFHVLDRSCTHGGAQCAYNRKRRTVQCTSLNHAEFDLSGKLLHGRTHGDLRVYPVRKDGSHLTISLEATA